jgi:hypothetical protein
MNFIKSLFARNPKSAPEVVSDLDALISAPVAFKFQDRTWKIKEIDTEQFLLLTENFARLDKLRTQKKITVEDLSKAYADLICDACPQMTPKVVMNMTQAQVGALLQLIIDTVTGKDQAKQLKKKITVNKQTIQKSMPS